MANEPLARLIAMTIVPNTNSVETLIARPSIEIEIIVRRQKAKPPTIGSNAASLLIDNQLRSISSTLISHLTNPNDSDEDKTKKKNFINDTIKSQIAKIS